MSDAERWSPNGAPAAAPARVGESIGVMVVASVRLYRDGLAQSLAAATRVVAVLGDAGTALREAARLAPDVLLLDMAVDGALALVQSLGEVAPQTRVVAFAVDEAHQGEVLACAEAGAAGWVGRDASAEELVQAVLHAARGELLCSARTAALLSQRVAALARERPSPPPAAAQLTHRELEVGALLSRGLTNKHIGRALGMQLPTVKNHVHSILEKLSVRSRGEAGALLRGLPPPQGIPASHE